MVRIASEEQSRYGSGNNERPIHSCEHYPDVPFGHDSRRETRESMSIGRC